MRSVISWSPWFYWVLSVWQAHIHCLAMQSINGNKRKNEYCSQVLMSSRDVPIYPVVWSQLSWLQKVLFLILQFFFLLSECTRPQASLYLMITYTPYRHTNRDRSSAGSKRPHHYCAKPHRSTIKSLVPMFRLGLGESKAASSTSTLPIKINRRQ